jgi:hypothetical protein
MQAQVEGSTITIPVPMHDPVRKGTHLSIIRQSHLSKSLFEAAD